MSHTPLTVTQPSSQVCVAVYASLAAVSDKAHIMSFSRALRTTSIYQRMLDPSGYKDHISRRRD